MKCPNCSTKITSKHYDADYEIYECPQCGNAYEPDELEEAQNGTSPKKRSQLAAGGVPQAKGKKRRAEIEEDAEAIEAFEKEQAKTVVKVEKATKHRDEIPLGQVVSIFADEIELLSEEAGVKIDRLNAQEFWAMNIARTLRYEHGVVFREKEVPTKLCAEHS